MQQSPSVFLGQTQHSEDEEEPDGMMLPDALLQSPKDEAATATNIPEMDLDLQGVVQQPTARVPLPEGPPEQEQDTNALLSSTSKINVDEEYSRDERMLNEFTKMHPMCSMESTSVKTMQMVSGMLEKAHVAIPELPVVSKTHNDMFLCKPNVSIGERECVCGTRCLAKFIARVRYGDDNEKGFVCKEYLLPEQYKNFLDGRGLPPQRQKCLLCSRYYVNYLYILSRTDPSFKAASCMSLQTFSNAVATGLPDHDAILETTASTPNHTNLVSCKEGYEPHAMLFVDENFAGHRIQRESKLSALSFRPIVRFCSTHYRYVKDLKATEKGAHRIIQVGIGFDDKLGGLGFQQPPPSTAKMGAASIIRSACPKQASGP